MSTKASSTAGCASIARAIPPRSHQSPTDVDAPVGATDMLEIAPGKETDAIARSNDPLGRLDQKVARNADGDHLPVLVFEPPGRSGEGAAEDVPLHDAGDVRCSGG